MEQKTKAAPIDAAAINEIRKRTEGSLRWRKDISQYARTLWIEATKDAGTLTTQEKTKTMTTIMARMEQQLTAAKIVGKATATREQIQRAVKALENKDRKTIQGMTATYTSKQEKKQEQKEKQEQEKKKKQKGKQEWMKTKHKDEEEDKEVETTLTNAREAAKRIQQQLQQSAEEERKKEEAKKRKVKEDNERERKIRNAYETVKNTQRTEDDRMWAERKWRGSSGTRRLV